LNEDHDTQIKRASLDKVSPIENEQPGSGTGAPYVLEIPDVKFRRVESSVQDEEGSAATIKRAELKPVQLVESESDDVLSLPLSGKWITSTSPTLIGTNFQVMKNMRYGIGHPEKILGMSKINTTALSTYLKPRNAYHFTKYIHAETHLLVQAFNSDETRNVIWENTTAVPSAGDFSATKVYPQGSYSTSSTVGNFCSAPNGQMAYCDGVNDCIWDGTESRIPAFILSGNELTNTSSTITNPNDVTEFINIYSNDVDNYIVIGGSAGGSGDGATTLFANFDGADGATTFTASTGQAVTFVGDAQIDTYHYKFGGSSLLVTYTEDDQGYCTVPAHANWNFSTNDFTLDCWIKYHIGHDYHSDYEGLFGQYVDTNNYWYLNAARPHSGNYLVTFKVVVASSTIAHYTWSFLDSDAFDDWNHVALVRDGTDVRFYIAGVKQTGTVIQAIGSSAMPNFATAALQIGICQFDADIIDRCFIGWLDDVRVGNLARYDANFTPGEESSTSAGRVFLVGSTRPVKGVKFYIPTGNGNVSTSSLTMKYYDGADWVSRTISDGTASGGVSLSQTGWVTWTEPQNSDYSTKEAKHYIEGYYLFWYQFSLSAGNATIYHATIQMRFQNIVDAWDGNFREVALCFIKTGDHANDALNDQTLNVLNIDDYIEADTSSYMWVAVHESDEYHWTFYKDGTSYIVAGFTERQTALYIDIPMKYSNPDTAQDYILTVKFWNGSEWTSVGQIADGTSITDGGTSKKRTFGQTGVIVWHNKNSLGERKKSINGSYPLYYYRLEVSNDLDDDREIRINYIAGIPVENKIEGHSFGIHAADRLMLACDNFQFKNQIYISAQDRPEVLNGTDSKKISFGGEEALTCGIPVFAQYASNIYNIILLFKSKETWILQWNQSSSGTSWSRFCISPTVGCAAPRTLKSASVKFGDDVGQTKNIAIWRGHDGIYISNGQAPFCVSDDISNVFDAYSTHLTPVTSAVKVNKSMILDEFAFVDEEKQEYHWLFASGSSTVLDKEYVLDLKQWKWFEIDRGWVIDVSTYDLQCGCSVIDTSGNKYTYGFIESGYCMRLENSYATDTADLYCTLVLGDFLPYKNHLIESRINKVGLVCAKKTACTTVVLRDYVDGCTTSETAQNITITDSTHNFSKTITDYNTAVGSFHAISLQHQSTSAAENAKGFEPYYLSVYVQKERESRD